MRSTQAVRTESTDLLKLPVHMKCYMACSHTAYARRTSQCKQSAISCLLGLRVNDSLHTFRLSVQRSHQPCTTLHAVPKSVPEVGPIALQHVLNSGHRRCTHMRVGTPFMKARMVNSPGDARRAPARCKLRCCEATERACVCTTHAHQAQREHTLHAHAAAMAVELHHVFPRIRARLEHRQEQHLRGCQLGSCCVRVVTRRTSSTSRLSSSYTQP
jgi:hypothetical protein